MIPSPGDLVSLIDPITGIHGPPRLVVVAHRIMDGRYISINFLGPDPRTSGIHLVHDDDIFVHRENEQCVSHANNP